MLLSGETPPTDQDEGGDEKNEDDEADASEEVLSKMPNPYNTPVSMGGDPNAVYEDVDEVLLSTYKLQFGDLAVYKCLDGFTTNGMLTGPTEVVLKCETTWKWTQHSHCRPMIASVMVGVTDSAAEEAIIDHATVSFKSAAGRFLADFIAEKNVVTATVPLGEYTVTATAPGYRMGQLEEYFVTGNAGAEDAPVIPLRRIQTGRGYKIELTWNRLPTDLDSWTFFGPNVKCKSPEGDSVWGYERDGEDHYCTYDCFTSWWHESQGVCANTGGITAVLERKSRVGRGPENTMVRGIGNCNLAESDCRLVFVVHYFSAVYTDVNKREYPEITLASSGAQIKIFDDDGHLIKKFFLSNLNPTSMTMWFPVFTMDTTNGEIYEGYWERENYENGTIVATEDPWEGVPDWQKPQSGDAQINADGKEGWPTPWPTPWPAQTEHGEHGVSPTASANVETETREAEKIEGVELW